MITFKNITVDNFEECIQLQPSTNQKRFLASNAYSLCEAYALTNHSINKPIAYAIYANESMIGFVFAIYQPIDPNDPDDLEDVYYLARIMIDEKYQGRGYGKEALKKFIELLKTYPYGPAKAVVLSCNPENKQAYSLFLSSGFKEMGIIDEDGDNLLRLELN